MEDQPVPMTTIFGLPVIFRGGGNSFEPIAESCTKYDEQPATAEICSDTHDKSSSI